MHIYSEILKTQACESETLDIALTSGAFTCNKKNVTLKMSAFLKYGQNSSLIKRVS